jgi:hypothetical protein
MSSPRFFFENLLFPICLRARNYFRKVGEKRGNPLKISLFFTIISQTRGKEREKKGILANRANT